MDVPLDDEEIVLLSPDGQAVGTAPKIASHHRDTPLHLAFSCYLVDSAGRLLITQRAHAKKTWPSVWTNSCCGHPRPDESLREAVRRRVRSELGLDATELTLILPRFRYRATMANGVVEYELCPVVRAAPAGPVHPDPDEVAGTAWRSWPECLDLVRRPEASPWYQDQVGQLAPLGSPPQWPSADPGLLPPAISW